MRLTSTDLSSLTAIAMGTAIAVGCTVRLINPRPIQSGVEATDVRLLGEAPIPEDRTHHDFQRTRRVIVRSAEETQGDEPRLVVEGEVATVTGSPLVYVDGVLVDEMPDLSPDDIERIEVIKGDAAIERFGADASGGAIQIFTKSAAAPNPGR